MSTEHFLYDNVGGRTNVFERLLLFDNPIIRNFKNNNLSKSLYLLDFDENQSIFYKFPPQYGYLNNVRVKPEKGRRYENVKSVLLDIGQGGLCYSIVGL